MKNCHYMFVLCIHVLAPVQYLEKINNKFADHELYTMIKIVKYFLI